MHPYRDLVKPGVRFVQSTVRSIDPAAKRVDTDAGSFDADVLVVGLGADLEPSATPGLVEGGHEFYTVAGRVRAARRAWRLRRAAGWSSAVTSTPFKCPPAPSETALLAARLPHRARTSRTAPRSRWSCPWACRSRRRLRRRQALLVAFAERGIGWHARPAGPRARPGSPGRACSATAPRCPTTCSLAYPFIGRRTVVAESGMTVDGWIPVNPRTLETSFPGVYAVGDVTSVGTPKAGVFAEGQAAVVADRISAPSAGEPESRTVRRPRDLLSRVRPRSGRDGRCARSSRGAPPPAGFARAVTSARRRQDRVRREPDPALVRPYLAVSKPITSPGQSLP